MKNSKRFRSLTKRLNELRKHLLPAKFSPTGVYTDKQIDMARGFRVLAHAEIESYLEEIVWEAVTKRVGDWQKTRKPNDLVICFLACYHGGWEDLDEDPGSEKLKPLSTKSRVKAALDSAEEVVKLATNNYWELIKRNHGVREKNLRLLLLPAGIRMADLDQTWISTLDSFGEQRGVAAHKSAVQVNADPKSELDTINFIMTGLKQLDEMMLKV
jgi:hypothetical protein